MIYSRYTYKMLQWKALFTTTVMMRKLTRPPLRLCEVDYKQIMGKPRRTETRKYCIEIDL